MNKTKKFSDLRSRMDEARQQRNVERTNVLLNEVAENKFEFDKSRRGYPKKRPPEIQPWYSIDVVLYVIMIIVVYASVLTMSTQIVKIAWYYAWPR